LRYSDKKLFGKERISGESGETGMQSEGFWLRSRRQRSFWATTSIPTSEKVSKRSTSGSWRTGIR